MLAEGCFGFLCRLTFFTQPSLSSPGGVVSGWGRLAASAARGWLWVGCLPAAEASAERVVSSGGDEGDCSASASSSLSVESGSDSGPSVLAASVVVRCRASSGCLVSFCFVFSEGVLPGCWRPGARPGVVKAWGGHLDGGKVVVAEQERNEAAEVAGILTRDGLCCVDAGEDVGTQLSILCVPRNGFAAGAWGCRRGLAVF